MKGLKVLFRIVKWTAISIGILSFLSYTIALVIVSIREVPEFEEGVVWASENPKLYVVGRKDSPPYCQIEIDGEMVDAYWGERETYLQLLAYFPGSEEETHLFSAGIWKTVWNDEKITLYAIEYQEGYDLGYDKIVLYKQN